MVLVLVLGWWCCKRIGNGEERHLCTAWQPASESQAVAAPSLALLSHDHYHSLIHSPVHSPISSLLPLVSSTDSTPPPCSLPSSRSSPSSLSLMLMLSSADVFSAIPVGPVIFGFVATTDAEVVDAVGAGAETGAKDGFLTGRCSSLPSLLEVLL